jgi:hypothetical protein
MGLSLFDISGHPTVLSNLPITFTFDGLLDGSANSTCQPIFLIERYRTVSLNINNSSASTDAEDGPTINGVEAIIY